MLANAKLLLPALTPSWRFFDSVGPSPRIEFAFLSSPHEQAAGWRAFRPPPAALSWSEILRRLIWSPERNESLFLTSCAERLLEAPTAHSLREIWRRIAADAPADAPPYLQFRICVVQREGDELVRGVAYVSPVAARSGPAPA